uniref:Gag-Pol polyprotein n=1 Tax=Tanacetum cinerariifolium TaxID=118510 RepID=A0A699I904_TANCI|nr:Gag-Pol polyprotein [Tanacetum cinerariifolium]
MSTQQDIYAAGFENRPPMLKKENYVPCSSRLLCVWGHFGDVRSEGLMLGEIKLLLVAFDSQLKVEEFLLDQEKQQVFNITQIKSWEVSFHELV